VPGRNLRFLVVEDHELQRRLLVQLLRSIGAQTVHSAEDGHSALKILRDPSRRVDIVVSDLSMPGMDGMEFIRHLSETGARVSLILASALEQDVLASIANMALAYKVKLLGAIDKPPTAKKLAPLIEAHRAGTPEVAAMEAAFSLDDIADAWTHNEFEMWFEPKISLANGAVHGMHATPRWRHPIRGMIGPQAFMPSVRARGLNDDFVWMTVQKAAAQCGLWQAKGLSLATSVNLGFGTLTDTNMASRVREIATREGIAPGQMVLSVTESALDTDQAAALENLARLRVDGFGLAIDDFGAGPMAVERLSRVAFTELKIQSSYVSGADSDETVRAGLAVGLETANQLKLITVADGIRSKEEWKLLHQWGCHFGQGPFISPALEGDAVSPWLARWRGSTIQ
jgi:EAL domain-containing protein (putative c-di-GMP-specific phosphodiesterase class I)/FixJ family two-component response regulator